MAEEQSIKEQIAAMEGWAIRARQMSETGNFKEAIEQFRLVNAQGRRLEWRGGNSGLKHLPRLREVMDLRKKITEARAVAQKAQDAANLIAKDTVLKAVETKRGKAAFKNFNRYASLLIEWLKKSREIANKEPWLDFETVISQQNGKLSLLHPGGYYARYVPELQKRMIIKAVEIGAIPLAFSDLDLSGVNFRGLNLQKASFYHANLERTNFTGANLSQANFSGANLKNAVLVNANLSHAIFRHATIDGMDLEGADVFDVLGLLPVDMYRTKNFRKARNLRSLPNFI